MQPDISDGSCIYLRQRYCVNLDQRIGSGASCDVFGGTDQTTTAAIAVKQIEDVLYNRRVAKCYLREAMISMHMTHPNTVSIYDATFQSCLDGSVQLYMIMEKIDRTLRHIIRSPTFATLTIRKIKYLMFQALHGLKYMHGCQLAHRDIKPANMLVDPHTWELKLCDYGLSANLADEKSLKTAVVTRNYRSPELLLESRSYDTAIDMWALGCSFAELFSGKVLFPGEDCGDQLRLMVDMLGVPEEAQLPADPSEEGQQLLQEALAAARPGSAPLRTQLPAERLPEGALSLLEGLLQWDPARRLSAADALAHPFFRDASQLFSTQAQDCAPAPRVFHYS